MSKITEISRRSMYHEDEGLACGPASSCGVLAEIVIDVDGQRVFLYGEWVDIAGDYYFEANTESLYDANERVLNAENEEESQKAIDARDHISQKKVNDDSDFESYYAELKQMIQAELKAHGLEYLYEDDEDGEDNA